MVVEMVRGTLIFAAMVIWPALGFNTEDIFIKSYGVYFQYKGQITTFPKHWYHHFQVPLPTPNHFGPWYCSQSLDKIDHSHIDGCRRYVNVTEQASLLPYVNQINSEIERHMQDFWKTVNETFPSVPPKENQNQFNSTPTPSESEYEDEDWHDYVYEDYMYNKRINEWRRFYDYYESHKRLPNEGFNKIESFLSENHEKFSYLMRDASEIETRDKLEQMMGQFYLPSLMKRYLFYISNVKNAILDLESGFLDPLLISEEQIMETFTKIKEELTKYGYASHQQYAVPHFYRRFEIYEVLRDENSLWISLKIKFVRLMPFFQVHVYPAPVRRNSDDIIQITGLPDQIMYNGKLFAPLTDKDLVSCPGTFIKECETNFVFTYITANTCEAALLRGNEDFIYQNCDFSLYRDKLFPHFEILPNFSIIVYKVDNFNLTCNSHHTRSTLGCFFCVMEIPCGCQIELHGAMAYNPHLLTCPHSHQWQLKSESFQNLAVSKSFSDGNYKIYGGLFWNLKPLYRMNNNDFYQDILSHREIGYNLKKVAREAAHNRTIYYSLYEAVASGRIKVPKEISNTSIYVLTILVLITYIIMLPFSIFIYCDSRRKT